MPTKRKKIFVVDDEPMLRESLARQLEEEGFECYPIDLKTDAYDQAIQLRPDLIISDIKAPVMDGFEFLRYLKANPFTKNIPFIFLTGFADLRNAIEAKKLGAVDFISKPYDFIELQGIIRRVLAEKWTESLYPPKLSISELADRNELKFSDWSTLLDLFKRATSRTHERISILTDSDLWNVHFIADHRVGILGGEFIRWSDIGSISEDFLLTFRDMLDNDGLDMGIMMGFFSSRPSTHWFANMIGIHLADEVVTTRMFRNVIRDGNPGDIISFFSEVEFDPDPLMQSRRFLPFMKRITSEIQSCIGQEFHVELPTAGKSKEWRVVELTLGTSWNNGVNFASKNEHVYVFIPPSLIWATVMKAWQEGFVRTTAFIEDQSIRNCLLKLFSRLEPIQVQDDMITIKPGSLSS